MKVAFILKSSANQVLLKQLIMECCDHKCLFYDVSNNYNILREIKPDVVLLSTDIKELNIFSFIDQLEVIDFNLVIVSSTEKWAIKAFKYGAIHYVVTPITKLDVLRIKEKVSMRMPILI